MRNRYNTFWRRFFALIIDGIILNIFSKVFTLFPALDSNIASASLTFIQTNIPYMYSILLIGMYGQTLGKMTMGIKVVDNETEDKIGYYQSFLREAIPFVLINLSFFGAIVLFHDVDIPNYELSTLGWIILFIPSGMLAIWGLLEIFTMLFDEKNRALHDKVADTVVVKTWQS